MISAHFAPQDGTSQVSRLGLEAPGPPLAGSGSQDTLQDTLCALTLGNPPQTRAGGSSLGVLGSAGSRREDGESWFSLTGMF